MSAIVETELIEELKSIKKDLEYIKCHMVDIDMTLTLEGGETLEEGLKEFEAGKTISLSVLTGVQASTPMALSPPLVAGWSL